MTGTPRIDRSAVTPAMASQHTLLEAEALAREIFAASGLDPVVPLFPTRTLLRFERRSDRATAMTPDIVITPLVDILRDTDHDAPAAESHCLTIDYLYRDAGNHKSFASIDFAGRADARDHALIATALLGGSEGFIPYQIGLADLQWQASGAVDFEANDHPWHDAVGIRIAPAPRGAPMATLDAAAGPRDLAELAASARRVATEGYDEFAAMMDLVER